MKAEDVVGAIAPRPLLLIRGTLDEEVPAPHAERLAAAAGEPKELWLVSGAGHCGALALDPDAYATKVADLVRRSRPTPD